MSDLKLESKILLNSKITPFIFRSTEFVLFRKSGPAVRFINPVKKRDWMLLPSGLIKKFFAFLSTSARNSGQSVKKFVNCGSKIIIFSK